MAQCDVISALAARGLDDVAEIILLYLDVQSLRQADQVCREWLRVISQCRLWRKLFKVKLLTDRRWMAVCEHYGWPEHFAQLTGDKDLTDHQLYRDICLTIVRAFKRLEFNWRTGRYSLQRIVCWSGERKGVYCLQYDERKIVGGLRDKTIKIWDRSSLEVANVLRGHTGSVLCLQYDENIIISGGSDCTVRVWDVQTGALVNTLHDHSHAVVHLRFRDDTLVTSSKGHSAVVWHVQSPTDISIRQALIGHKAAVNAVGLDEKYIVTASRDTTIKVWNKTTGAFVRTLTGHTHEITCMHYFGNVVVSGGMDNTVRLWYVKTGLCVRVLKEHTSLVRCIHFDGRRIVSGDIGGTIKVWDLQAALNLTTPAVTLCLFTLRKNAGRIYNLQFDDLQIVSSSSDDTIFIWDFLCKPLPEAAGSSSQACSNVD